jgi:hypothetical protein
VIDSIRGFPLRRVSILEDRGPGTVNRGVEVSAVLSVTAIKHPLLDLLIEILENHIAYRYFILAAEKYKTNSAIGLD